MTPNPYQGSLGDRDPLASLAEVLDRIGVILGAMSEADLERAWAPGKSTVRPWLVHLVQTEQVAAASRAAGGAGPTCE